MQHAFPIYLSTRSDNILKIIFLRNRSFFDEHLMCKINRSCSLLKLENLYELEFASPFRQ